jgi:6-bladed beta-propeller protein
VKRALIFCLLALGTVAYAQRGAAPGQPPAGQGQAGPGGRGRGLSPEQQAALAKQDELEKSSPQIPFDAVSLPLQPGPENTIGETVGVAVNSQKHLFVYTRTGNLGPARGATAAKLFEFDQAGKFLKEWGAQAYGFSFAHTVRVDKDDNVWVTDEGSNMVMKFNKQGIVTMVLGRKDEAIDYIERFLERGQHSEAQAPNNGAGRPNSFDRPTDVAWDTQGNVFVSDGYGNSRVAKFSKDGEYLKTVGQRGNGPDGFSTPHTIANDAKGNIYVGDRGNNRIKVYDPELNLIKTFTNVRSPWAVCITPGPTQYLYSADAGGKIYKLDLEGNLVGWLGSNGKKVGQFYWVHEMACPSENEIYTGEAQNWRVQKLTLHPATKSTK